MHVLMMKLKQVNYLYYIHAKFLNLGIKFYVIKCLILAKSNQYLTRLYILIIIH